MVSPLEIETPRQTEIDISSIRRILLTRLRFMGDVILTTPLIRQLRRAFPQAHLAYMTEAPYASLLQHNPHLDEIIAIETHPAGSPWAELRRQWRIFRDLRQRRFDLVIDLFGNPRSAQLTWATGARWRVGGDYRGRRWLYTVRVPQKDPRVDAIAFHQRSLQVIGIDGGDKRTELFLTDAEKQAGAAYLKACGFSLSAPIVGLHPGATWPNKIWPAASFAAVARQLVSEGVQVFLTCGPGEEAIVREVREQSGGRAVAGEVLPLRKLASILHHFSGMIANDGGVMHMAVAVGTPTIGIFGPGEPDIWFPYDPPHRAFWTDIDCRPCHQNHCPLGTLECMHRIAPEQVAQTMLHKLKKAA